MEKETNITVILADDHELLREGFQSMASKFPGIQLVVLKAIFARPMTFFENRMKSGFFSFFCHCLKLK